MDKLEQKLKNYYKYHAEYQPDAVSDEFLQRLLALESSPEAVKPPRRRHLLPIAAAIALALGLSGWAWLHFSQPEADPSAIREVTLEEPAGPITNSPNQTKPEPPSTELPDLPGDAVSMTKPDRESASKPLPAGSTPVRPRQAASAASNVPTQASEDSAQPVPDSAAPEPPEETTSVHPIKNTQVKPAGTVPAWPYGTTPWQPVSEPDDDAPVPPDSDSPAGTDPTPAVLPDEPAPGPVTPDPPEENPPSDHSPQADPTPADPPHEDPPPDSPQIIHLKENDIDASYLMEDGRQTLALRCLSTGASVELDVTGWQEELDETPTLPPDPPAEEQSPEETPAQAASTYTGRSSIVDVIFDKNIVFYLILEEDGTVRVKLDVTEA